MLVSKPGADGSVLSSHALSPALGSGPALAMGGLHAKPMSATAAAAALPAARAGPQRTATPARGVLERTGPSQQVCGPWAQPAFTGLHDRSNGGFMRLQQPSASAALRADNLLALSAKLIVPLG